MKTIIAGSRTLKDPKLVATTMREVPFDVTEIVSGAAPNGIDKLAEIWGEEQGIPVKRFLADWNNYGRAAGSMRNVDMARYADACVVIWDGRSAGSRNMVDEALRAALPLVVRVVRRTDLRERNARACGLCWAKTIDCPHTSMEPAIA